MGVLYMINRINQDTDHTSMTRNGEMDTHSMTKLNSSTASMKETKKLRVYSVMLEGTDDSFGYFINVAVAALTPKQASMIACERAQELGLKIIDVEEIKETNEPYDGDIPQVLSFSGKSYYPSE